MDRVTIARAIDRELRHQRDKFGEHNVLTVPDADPFLKLTILAEEVGEVAHAVTELSRQHTATPHVACTVYDVIAELVQVAAVATAWLLSIEDPDA